MNYEFISPTYDVNTNAKRIDQKKTPPKPADFQSAARGPVLHEEHFPDEHKRHLQHFEQLQAGGLHSRWMLSTQTLAKVVDQTAERRALLFWRSVVIKDFWDPPCGDRPGPRLGGA